MKTPTKITITTALITGATILGFSLTDEKPEIKPVEGYTLNNPTAPEAEIQRTLIAPDGSKFTIARHLLAIAKLDEQIDATVDKVCTGETEECEIQNEANAEFRVNATEEKNKLLTDIISVKTEFKMNLEENSYTK